MSLPSGVQLAWTDYRVLASHGDSCCLMEVRPVTGFKHQIRVHLADGLMCPILGDHKFTGPLVRRSGVLKKKLKSLNMPPRGAMLLHAYELRIPDYRVKGKSLVIRTPLPERFQSAAKKLGLPKLK